MRRMVVVGLVGGAVVVTAVALARRTPPSSLTGEPDWAPLSLTGPPPAPAAGRTLATSAAIDAPVHAPTPEPVYSAAPEADAIAAVSATGAWVEPDLDGSCPESHPVKGNRSSRIYHVPGGHFYARTKAERCYCDAAAAEADGYRAAKR